MPAGRRRSRWREQLPEPGFLWIEWSPAPWPAVEEVWTDLARGGIEWGEGESVPDPAEPRSGMEGAVVYLPPVPASMEVRRRETLDALLEAGGSVVLHQRPGEVAPAHPAVTPIYDLLPVLWSGDPAGLADLPAGAAAVWPLVPGFTDDPRRVDRYLEALCQARVTRVIGVDLALSPVDKRRLVEAREEVAFERLFHEEGGAERGFATRVSGHGLDWWLDRPLPRRQGRRRENRRLGGGLLAVADLWQRLDRPVGQGQAFYRAARWLESTHYDVTALLREGNLDVVEAVDAVSAELLAEVVGTGRSRLLEKLRREYVGSDGPSGE